MNIVHIFYFIKMTAFANKSNLLKEPFLIPIKNTE